MASPIQKSIRMLPRLALAVALLATLAACSDDDGSMGPETPQHEASAQQSGLELTVQTPKASYEFGESIQVTAIYENVSRQPITLDFARGNPPRFSNVNINIDDGQDAAHFTAGSGTAETATLAPGQKKTYRFTWDQKSRFTRKPVDPGDYRVIVFSGLDGAETLRWPNLFVRLQ